MSDKLTPSINVNDSIVFSVKQIPIMSRNERDNRKKKKHRRRDNFTSIVYQFLESNFQLNVLFAYLFSHGNCLRIIIHFVLFFCFLRSNVSRQRHMERERERTATTLRQMMEKTGCKEKSKQHQSEGEHLSCVHSSYFRFMSLSPLHALLLLRSEVSLVFITNFKFEEWRRVSWALSSAKFTEIFSIASKYSWRFFNCDSSVAISACGFTDL